jgi:hypothetical protein
MFGLSTIQFVAAIALASLVAGFGSGYYTKGKFADAAAYKAEKAVKKAEDELRAAIAKRDGEITAQYAINDRIVKQLGTKVVTRETQRINKNPALADCKLDPDSVRELNQAASVPANPGGGSVGLRLPGVSTDGRQPTGQRERAQPGGSVSAELPSARGGGEESKSVFQALKDMLK